MATLYGGKSGVLGYGVVIESDTTDGSTVFLDVSDNGNTITKSGSVAHSTDRSKFGDSSIEFSTVADYLEFPGNPTMSINSIALDANVVGVSIDFWVYFTSLPGSDTKILIGKDSQNECYISVNSSGQVTGRALVSSTVSATFELTSPVPVTAGSWHHVYLFHGGSWVGSGGSGETYYVSSKFFLVLGVDGAVTRTDETFYTAGDDAVSFRRPAYYQIGFSNTLFADEIRSIDYYPVSGSFTPLTSPYVGDGGSSAGAYYVSGTVKEGEVNIARIVRAYSRSTGALLGSTTSDDTTGEFTISNLPDDSEVYVVCLDDDDGTEYNALIEDRVIPVEEE